MPHRLSAGPCLRCGPGRSACGRKDRCDARAGRPRRRHGNARDGVPAGFVRFAAGEIFVREGVFAAAPPGLKPCHGRPLLSHGLEGRAPRTEVRGFHLFATAKRIAGRELFRPAMSFCQFCRLPAGGVYVRRPLRRNKFRLYVMFNVSANCYSAAISSASPSWRSSSRARSASA